MLLSLTSLSPFAKKIFNVLNTNTIQTRLVGGAVRDLILKKNPYDIDFATTGEPSIIMQKLIKNHIYAIPHNIKYGTITAINKKEKIEITTLRIDEKSSGRHVEKIKFHSSFEEDAARRDFTFNALYADINGKVFDFFNGIQDLKNGYVKFIGDPQKRIQEDHLRLLRYVRFYTKYGKKEPDIELLKKHQHLIKKLSKERRRTEWLRLLDNDQSIIGLNLMYNANLLPSSMIVTNNLLQAFKKWDTYYYNNWIRFAFLLRETNNIQNIILDLALSKKEINWLKIMHNPPKKWLDAIYLYDLKILKQFQNLNFFSNQKIPPHCSPPMKKYFPVSGESLLSFGVSRKNLGNIKKYLIQEWIQSEFTLSNHELFKKAQLFHHEKN